MMMMWQASNAADILSLAHKYNAQPLKSFALAMISRNVEEVRIVGHIISSQSGLKDPNFTDRLKSGF